MVRIDRQDGDYTLIFGWLHGIKVLLTDLLAGPGALHCGCLMRRQGGQTPSATSTTRTGLAAATSDQDRVRFNIRVVCIKVLLTDPLA